jgi:Protein of unknown function (DUF2490)
MANEDIDFMHTRILVAALAATAIGTPALAQGPDPDFEVWTSLVASGPIKDKVLGSLELTVRNSDDPTRGAQMIARTMIGYQVSKPLAFFVGYLHSAQRPDGVAATIENRYFTQAAWTIGKIGRVTVASRTRAEARTIEGRVGTAYRVRERLGFTLPIKGSKSSFVATTEGFLALNTTGWGARAGLEQWRNFAGISFPLVKGLSIETGYLNRYAVRSGRRDRMDHILTTTVNYRF